MHCISTHTATELETPKEVMVQIENRRRASVVAQRRMSMVSVKSTTSQKQKILSELRAVSNSIYSFA